MSLVHVAQEKNSKNAVGSYKIINNEIKIKKKGKLSNKKIMLKDLNYWNVDSQEAYFSAIEANEGFKKQKK